mmetsp:Transcript_29660/g.54393  ORF Transcript_29660/g.54393 Transcript_29660/m.54393 type:complete len:356 (-) Transcript_29660:1121-2188(-)
MDAHRAESPINKAVEPLYKAFVGGLSHDCLDEGLRNAFSRYDPISSVVMFDKFTNKHRGFGFVTFSSGEILNDAIRDMNGAEVYGSSISVKVAVEESEMRRKRPYRGERDVRRPPPYASHSPSYSSRQGDRGYGGPPRSSNDRYNYHDSRPSSYDSRGPNSRNNYAGDYEREPYKESNRSNYQGSSGFGGSGYDNRVGYEPSRGGYDGGHKGSYESAGRNSYDGPSRGGYTSPPRGGYDGPSRGSYESSRGSGSYEGGSRSGYNSSRNYPPSVGYEGGRDGYNSGAPSGGYGGNSNYNNAGDNVGSGHGSAHYDRAPPIEDRFRGSGGPDRNRFSQGPSRSSPYSRPDARRDMRR